MNISDQHIDNPKGDMDMMDDMETMEDIGLIMDILNKERISISDEEIESRLQCFHERRKPRLSYKMILWPAVAAAIALAVILTKPFGSTSETTELHLDGNAIVASNQQPGHPDQKAEPKVVIPVTTDAVTHEQQIESKEIEKALTTTDTIKLNISMGHSCKVVLPDGSCAYLHPGSKMVYPKRFDGTERRVRLEGEAYFVVRKDKKHPFIVATACSETLVTGTEFNVNTGDLHNPSTRVTLVSGSVQLSNSQSHQKVFLTPGEQGIILADRPIGVCEADTMGLVAWRDGYFYFDDTTLENILQQICQYYGVPAVYSDARLGRYRMHFTLRRDQDLKSAVAMLNRMKKAKVTLMYGKLYVTE